MEQIKLFQIRAGASALAEATRGDVADDLSGPLSAIASDIAAQSTKEPLVIYICSDDGDRDARNDFALATARLLRGRLPGLLVIDCDFLTPGLGGAVPKPAGPGFLDLLLYGSSLSFISQHAANGVTVIGPGSFPVSRRTPFLMDAFDDTARFLVGTAGCVIFCGPLLDGDAVHPVARRVDLAVIVGRGRAMDGELTVAETQLAASREKAVWSMRLSDPSAEPASGAPSEPGVQDPELERILEKKTAQAKPTRRQERQSRAKKEKAELDAEIAKVIDVPFDEEGPADSLESRAWNTSVPKIVTITLGILVIGSIIWWLYLTKSFRGDDEPMEIGAPNNGQRSAAHVVAGRDAASTLDGGAIDAIVDTLAADGSEPTDVSRAESQLGSSETPPEPTPDVTPETVSQPPGRTGAASPDAIDILENLAEYGGSYLVHASSFRGLDRVKDDFDFLTRHGYEVIVSHVDLGEKGLWYRVYIGPFATEAAAENAKITLDENSRFRSTRITKVPMQSAPRNKS